MFEYMIVSQKADDETANEAASSRSLGTPSVDGPSPVGVINYLGGVLGNAYDRPMEDEACVQE